eukprot:1905189-Rhodomonas_salina.1
MDNERLHSSNKRIVGNALFIAALHLSAEAHRCDAKSDINALGSMRMGTTFPEGCSREHGFHSRGS